jgi:hypothetical protein
MFAKVSITLVLVSGLLLAAAVLVGCGGGNDRPAGPTFEAVAPILSKHCIGCHQDSGIAPFSLTSYADAKAKAALIKPAVTSREMPPSNADNSGSCGRFDNARWLTAAEIATLSEWVDAGASRGTGPATLEVPEPEHLADGDVDATLDIGGDYLPDAARADDYRCFVVDPGLPADKLLVAYEVVPGEPRVVHHAVLYMLATDEAAADAAALDAAEAGLGYTCFGGARVDGTAAVAAWAPGTPVTRYPEGTGVRVPGGRKAVLQIHYNLAGGARPDHTRVRLHVVDAVPHEALIAPLANVELSLPPGQRLVTSAATGEIPDGPGLDMLGVYPHMHLRGRTLRVERLRDDQTTCLLDVPSWDFHWQEFFFYDNPVDLRAGDRLRITCGYDTSADTKTVTWGEGTADEMCIAGFYAVPRPAPTPEPPVCPDAANPLFGSCLETLLAGCFAPDRSGTCTSDGGAVRWSDGSTVAIDGPEAGLTGPAGSHPCIAIAMEGGAYRLSKGEQSVVYAAADDRVTVTCPDGTTIAATSAQAASFNVCAGLTCPPVP